MDRRKLGISLVIVVVLGLHAAPVLFYQGRRQTMWPFLTWAMYKNSRPAGPIEARRTHILAITATGKTERVSSGFSGLPLPALREMYVEGLRHQDSAVAQQLLRRLNLHRKDPVVELRVVGQTYRLTPQGVVIRENPVLSFRLDSSVANTGAAR
jgi:hypothetical protein